MSQTAPKIGNPAVVGLAGFGLTTLMLQLHSLGLVSRFPVLVLGLIFGGLAQMIAGLQEQKCGNNFGYSAFTSYGAFWIAFCGLLLLDQYTTYTLTAHDKGWFLVVWTLYTLIMWVASWRIHGAMAFTFTALLAGFILLDLGYFFYAPFKIAAAYVLIVCALSAWYMMAGAIYADVAGRPLLPMGKPWVTNKK